MGKSVSTYARRTSRMIFALTAIFAVVAVITVSLFFSAGATEGKEIHSLKKYYSSMTVSEGDTLWDIGKMYSGGNESQSEYAKNIMKLNNMNDDKICEGMNLVYYYYDY